MVKVSVGVAVVVITFAGEGEIGQVICGSEWKSSKFLLEWSVECVKSICMIEWE